MRNALCEMQCAQMKLPILANNIIYINHLRVKVYRLEFGICVSGSHFNGNRQRHAMDKIMIYGSPSQVTGGEMKVGLNSAWIGTWSKLLTASDLRTRTEIPSLSYFVAKYTHSYLHHLIHFEVRSISSLKLFSYLPKVNSHI